MNAIEQNGHLFKDKVVLDIGCGTGILSCSQHELVHGEGGAVDCIAIIPAPRASP